MTPGRFITLEGGEGAGKTTLAELLAARLRSTGLEVIVTREPGGTPNAEALRTLLVEGETGRWSPLAETLLLYAARTDHVERLIKPALSAGHWVICDRFSDSTRAYQGAAGGLDADRIAAIDTVTLNGFTPDLTFMVDMDPAIGLERARARGGGHTRFERQAIPFHNTLRRAFVEIARENPDRCILLDGAQPPKQVADAALAGVRARLGVIV